MSRTRTFEIMIGPIFCPDGEGVSVAVPPSRIVVRGTQWKFHADYFQVLDVHDVVIFATPHNLIMWFREVRDGNSATTLNLVTEDVDESETPE